MRKPEKLKEEHLKYLDDVRKSGATNMYGAASFLRDVFSDLSKKESRKILDYWMYTFSERHSDN